MPAGQAAAWEAWVVVAGALLAEESRRRQARRDVRWLRGRTLQSGGGGQNLQFAGLLHRP